MQWRITVRLIDVDGFPAAGVDVSLSALPPGQPAVITDPPPSDVNGETVGFVKSEGDEFCVTVEAQAGGVTLNEKPYICFSAGR
jgi:hypothetical protein